MSSIPASWIFSHAFAFCIFRALLCPGSQERISSLIWGLIHESLNCDQSAVAFLSYLWFSSYTPQKFYTIWGCCKMKLYLPTFLHFWRGVEKLFLGKIWDYGCVDTESRIWWVAQTLKRLPIKVAKESSIDR